MRADTAKAASRVQPVLHNKACRRRNRAWALHLSRHHCEAAWWLNRGRYEARRVHRNQGYPAAHGRVTSCIIVTMDVQAPTWACIIFGSKRNSPPRMVYPPLPNGSWDFNVRFGSKADICVAPARVRFTPNSDRESGFLQKVMSALPPKADMCSARGQVC